MGKPNRIQKFNGRYRISTTRLRGWNYAGNGMYFITICTKHRVRYFGSIRQCIMDKTEMGVAAESCWNAIPTYFPFVELDAFIVMPDHIHGLLRIRKSECSGGSNNAFGPQSNNLASIIRGFKSGVTMYARKRGIQFEWQSRYYESVVRDRDALDRIKAYIINNPRNWIRSQRRDTSRLDSA